MLLSQHLKMKIIIVLIVATLAASGSAVSQCSVDRCGLYRSLKNAAVGDELLKNFLCIADHASGFNILHKKKPGFHGIFQISEGEWCDNKKCGSKNLCDMPCSHLQDLNLTDDIQCAMKINNVQGLKAWPEWVTNCQNKDLNSYLEGC